MPLAVTAGVLLSGCTDDPKEEAQEVRKPSRMEDPAYVATLRQEAAVRKASMTKLAGLEREIKALKDAAEAPGREERLAALEAQRDAALKEYEEARKRATAAVRQRIHKDLDKTGKKPSEKQN